MIKEARKAKGYSQFELAKLMGVSVMSIQLWEREVGMPKPENRVKLEELLGIKIGEK